MPRLLFAVLAFCSLLVAGWTPSAFAAGARAEHKIEPPSQEGAPQTYVQKFNDRGERYSSENEAAADMEIVSQRIRSAGYVILHRFIAADADRNAPWNYYRFEITYIAPHRANIDRSGMRTLEQLHAGPDDCQVLNPEFCNPSGAVWP